MDGYRNLTVLHLSGNIIRSIGLLIFVMAWHLKELDLSGNKIDDIQSSWPFATLGELEKLDLRNNFIRIDDPWFFQV